MKRTAHAKIRCKERLGRDPDKKKTRRSLNRDFRLALARGSVMLHQTGTYVIFGNFATFIVALDGAIKTVMWPLSNEKLSTWFALNLNALVAIENLKPVISRLCI